VFLLLLLVVLQGEIPNIRIMSNDFEHSISIDFDIHIYKFQVFLGYLFTFWIRELFFRKFFILHHLLVNFEENK
jgi:hypothetical protein